MEQFLGKEVAGYRLQEVLGRGGMGIVFKAEDVSLERLVAVKMLDPVLARDASFLRRFQSEARALARLNDPNIVSIHAMPATEIGQFIVMEYVDGTTLSAILRDRGTLPWEEALPVFRQFLTAIGHAHAAGIIHRDIKPSNIMLTLAGVVKVTDFGLAKMETGIDHTRTQGVAGTLYYMSPEQVKGLANVDHRSDLYSVGMTFYEMLSGRTPFEKGSSEFAIQKAIVEEKFAPPTQYNPSIPKALSKIVLKAIEKDPDRRYQSAEEMLEALEALAGENPVAKAPSGVRKTAAPASSRPRGGFRVPQRPAIYLSAAGLVLLLAASGVFFWPVGSGAPPAESNVTQQVAQPDTGAVVVPPLVDPGPVETDDDGGTGRVEPPGTNPGTNPGTAPARPPETVRVGTLLLSAEAGGEVLYDGRVEARAGQPGAVVAPVGNRSVTCRYTGAAGTVERRFSVNVQENGQTPVNCIFTASVSLQAKVAASDSIVYAYLTLDNRSLEQATPTVLNLEPGRHRIAARWRTLTGEVELNVQPELSRQNRSAVIELK